MLIALADIYQRNNFMKSISLLETSLQILQDNNIKNNLLGKVLLKLANLYVFEQKKAKVEEFYLKYLTLNEELYGPSHEKVFYCYYLLTEFYFNNNNREKGLQHFIQAESIIKNINNGNETSEEYANLLILYINYLYLNENTQKSNILLQNTIDTSINIMEKIYGKNHIKLLPFIDNNYKLAYR